MWMFLPFSEWTSVIAVSLLNGRELTCCLWCVALLCCCSSQSMQETCPGEKSLLWFIPGGFLYSKAIITSQSRCHCKGLLILCSSRNSRRLSVWWAMEVIKEEVHLPAGWSEMGRHTRVISLSLQWQSVSFLSEEGLEQRECSEVAMGKWEGKTKTTELANGREKGSSALDQDFKELNTATQPGWDLLLGTKRDTDQNQVGQVTRLSLMLVDVF